MLADAKVTTLPLPGPDFIENKNIQEIIHMAGFGVRGQQGWHADAVLQVRGGLGAPRR